MINEITFHGYEKQNDKIVLQVRISKIVLCLKIMMF